MCHVIDITRWLAEHPAFDPEANARAHPRHQDQEPLRTGAIRALDAPLPAPPSWRVQALLPDGDFVIVVGEDGVSKSTVVLHIAAAVAGAYPVFDSFTTTVGPVLIVSEEDDTGTILMRLEAIVAGHGWNRERVFTNVHFMALEGVNISERDWQVRLHKEVERIGAVLLILDPLAELIGGDENDNSAVRPILKWIRSLGCSVILVHHFGKATEGRSSGDRIRGASAWRRGARVILTMEALPGDRIRVQQLKLTKARRHPPFMLHRTIVSDVENDANWQQARLVFETDSTGRLLGAQEWVIARLDESDDGILSTDLRDMAHGSGFSGQDISNAIRNLQETGKIEAHRRENDHANARRWRRRVPF
jgi:hypothetical protein